MPTEMMNLKKKIDNRNECEQKNKINVNKENECKKMNVNEKNECKQKKMNANKKKNECKKKMNFCLQPQLKTQISKITDTVARSR